MFAIAFQLAALVVVWAFALWFAAICVVGLIHYWRRG